MVINKTDILEQVKLNELAALSASIFKRRGTYTDNFTLTQFRLLVCWGLYHGERITDAIVFIDDCADHMDSDMELIDAAVLCVNLNDSNLSELDIAEHDRSNIIDGDIPEYAITSTTVNALKSVIPRDNYVYPKMVKLLEFITNKEYSDGVRVDCDNFSRYA